MQKKYMIAIMMIALSFIFVLTCFLMNDGQRVTISPIKAFEQKEKISFISSWGAYDTNAPALKEIFKRIGEKYSSFEVEDASMAGEDFLFILKTDFASGNPPNVFGLWPGSDFNLLVEQGKVADLTELLKANPQWYNQFGKEAWDYVTVDGRIYGLPIEMIYEGLFINKDLFERYRVKVPTTYEELLEAVHIFKANGIIPIAYNQSPEGSYIYQNIVMKLGGKEDVEHPFDAEGQIKPCFIDGMYYMKELYEAGAFPNQFYSMDDKKRNELFLQKKAAMIVQGSWFIGDSALSSNDRTVDVVPFPDMPGGKADSSAIIYGCGNGIFHMSQQAYEDPTIRTHSVILLQELTKAENVAEFAKCSGLISNIDLGEYAPKQTVMGSKGENLVKQSKELVGAVDWFINRQAWENIIIEQFPCVLKGKQTPEAVFEQVAMAH